MPGPTSFSSFVGKRARLAGRSLLEQLGDANPWFAALDKLEAKAALERRDLVSFGNYDYLGLSRHPAVRSAAVEAIEGSGPGVGGSRLIGGERSFHAAFENALADFMGVEATLALVSGYLTNVTLIPHLLGAGDILIVDELCHSSILTGCKGTNAKFRTFRHNDVAHLDHILAEERAAHRNCLIVIESLYSMDGDCADLPRLLELRDRHGCWLMIDEAHSIGVMGKTGRGITEHFGIPSREIDIITGTLSKTFVSSGGFICAHGAAIEWLRYVLPGFVFSVGLSPPTVAAAHAALDLLMAEPDRVARLQARSARFLESARAAGLNTGNAMGCGIVPILFNDLPTTMAKAAALAENGIYAPPVAVVGVPQDAPRIRFFLSAGHTDDDIDRAISILAA